MSYGGPGFPYEKYRNALYAACLEARDAGINLKNLDNNNEIDPRLWPIVDKHLAPFVQWKLNDATDRRQGT